MQIIILGAGRTGGSLAASLVNEHSITLVDENDSVLEQLQSQYDLRTIQGYGAYPKVLQEAGADRADMLIAAADNDESNILACWVAQTVFKIPIKIAQIRSADYFLSNNQFFTEYSPVDYFINPANLITHTIHHLIEYPGALRIFDFGGEAVKLVATKPSINSPLLGKQATVLPEIVAIYRHNQEQPVSLTTIEINDDIIFLAESHKVAAILNVICPTETHAQKHKRVMIIGGGLIGELLAEKLEHDHQVKIIEQNVERCELLGRRLKNTLILHGNGCDAGLLRNEEVENIDCFCALTNSDSDNIVGSLYSKQLNAKQVIALINREAYLNLIFSGYIHVDIAISPQQITVSAILKHLRDAQIIQAYSLRQGAAEALEIMVNQAASVEGCTIQALNLPEAVRIIGLIRNDRLLYPQPDTVIQYHDRVLVFISNKKYIHLVESLFTANQQNRATGSQNKHD
ncbi:MAG: Trk system potassium transporter TrkA [Proteobacteria bacterium]|nr:Trk system potassium transporter TrkA [Pseudomonadota bacterium]